MSGTLGASIGHAALRAQDVALVASKVVDEMQRVALARRHPRTRLPDPPRQRPRETTSPGNGATALRSTSASRIRSVIVCPTRANEVRLVAERIGSFVLPWSLQFIHGSERSDQFNGRFEQPVRHLVPNGLPKRSRFRTVRLMKGLCRVIVAAGCVASLALSGSRGHQGATSAEGPGARWGHAMAYDEARDRVVVFGGQRDRSTALGDTWLWDGETWARGAESGPTARSYAAMAYDQRRARVVLFGGREHLKTAADDTWEWDGLRWSRATRSGAGARDHHTLAWDDAAGYVVLFGGFSGSAVTADTWSWDGSEWRLLAADGPPPRATHALAFDSRRRRLVLFGGLYLGGLYGDVWEWSNGSWHRNGPVFAPTLDHHAMVFDAARGELVAFGGKDYRFTFRNRTLRFTEGAWQEASAEGPQPRINPGLVYHERRRQVVLFGGRAEGDKPLGDLWLWDGTRWSRSDGRSNDP